MRHNISSETRLAGPGQRLLRRLFDLDDPHGWADYHCIETADGTLWVHCHVSGRAWCGLELVDVPMDMRGHAHQLLFGILAHGRAGQPIAADRDIEGDFSAPVQNFRQMATLRGTEHEDAEHSGMLRIVDWDQPATSGFPRRLFASHIMAWAEFTEEPARKEAMCRRSLAIFPGYFLEMSAGADIVPGKADLTDTQFRANLSAYIILAHALFDQGRANEGTGYLEQAIARCPGWACAQRHHILKAYRAKDRYVDFWRSVDIEETCARLRPANTMGPMPVFAETKRAKTGTKSAARKRTA